MQQLKTAATEIVESQIMKCFYCANSDKQWQYVYQIGGTDENVLRYCGKKVIPQLKTTRFGLKSHRRDTMGLVHVPDKKGLHNKIKVDGSSCCTTISLEYDIYMEPVGGQQELQCSFNLQPLHLINHIKYHDMLSVYHDML